ncbi:MAG: RluA family pseudouridine synthase [Thermoanaerobaculales bacterium]|nr:RluA family pseudouridine synthase [Thermoanaerobaculales bacterium]
MTTHHEFTVPGEFEGIRLDRCLPELNPDWTRSRARKLIDDGNVLLNNAPSKASATVHAGDTVAIDEPPPRPLDVEAEDIPLEVIHEDEDLLLINKPAGLVIHPAAGNPSGTLVNALLHYCQDLSGIGGVERPGIVHRLDKDTTGIMVVAKSDRAHLALSIAFRRHTIRKTYLAVCYGTPKDSEGVIDAAIDRHPRNRQEMAVVNEGRPARTLYRVEQQFAGISMVSCNPVTGRTHQIRVHMAHIGHAIVGDPLYAGRQWRNLVDPRVQAACRSFPRQALHARRIAFEHPVSKEKVEFEAPLPPDLEELLRVLRESTD